MIMQHFEFAANLLAGALAVRRSRMTAQSSSRWRPNPEGVKANTVITGTIPAGLRRRQHSGMVVAAF
jgi:hypothetical protein